MSDKTASNGMSEDREFHVVELGDDQIENLSGGGLLPDERYICDTCGVEAEFLGLNHNNVFTYQCPSCHRAYGAWWS